jgi:hypothetical protein
VETHAGRLMRWRMRDETSWSCTLGAAISALGAAWFLSVAMMECDHAKRDR